MKTKSNLLKAAALFALAIMYLGSATAARAEVSACDSVWGDNSGIVMKQVDYVPKTSATASNLQASKVNGSYIVRLRGWLYYAENAVVKDAPVIIYNHGHGREPGEPCAIAKYFVKKDFVVFVPLRRGSSAKTPNPIPPNWKKIESTGVYTDDYVESCKINKNCTSCNGIYCPEGLSAVDYMRQQVADVADQLSYIKTLPAVGKNANGKLADSKRIAIAGHSYGGSLMVFANAELKNHNVAINISGAELSWNSNPHWKSVLSATMNDVQQRPIYFLQPKNGVSLMPTKTLFGIAVDREYRSQAAIFPPAPCFKDPCDTSEDSEAKQAHSTFVKNKEQVELWGPSVVEFINRYPLS